MEEHLREDERTREWQSMTAKGKNVLTSRAEAEKKCYPKWKADKSGEEGSNLIMYKINASKVWMKIEGRTCSITYLMLVF